MFGEYFVFLLGAVGSFPVVHWALNKLIEWRAPLRQGAANVSAKNRNAFLSTMQLEAVERVQRCVWLVAMEARDNSITKGATVGGSVKHESLHQLRSASRLVSALFPVEIYTQFKLKVGMIIESPAHQLGDPDRAAACVVDILLQSISAPGLGRRNEESSASGPVIVGNKPGASAVPGGLPLTVGF